MGWQRQRLDWCCHKPGNLWGPQQPEGAEDPPLEPSRQHNPAGTWPQTSNLQDRQKVPTVLSPLVCGASLKQPRGTDANPSSARHPISGMQVPRQAEAPAPSSAAFCCSHFPSKDWPLPLDPMSSPQQGLLHGGHPDPAHPSLM